MKPDYCRPGPEAGHHDADPSIIVQLQMADFSRLKLVRCYLPTARPFLYCSLIFLIMQVVPIHTDAQVFENAGFETSATCSVTDCQDEDISCVNGWWNYLSPQDIDATAWQRYSCYDYPSCGDYRGLLIASQDSPSSSVVATTQNPLSQYDPNDKYSIMLDVLPLDVENDFFLIIRGSDASSGNPNDADLLGYAEVTTAIETCGSVRIQLNSQGRSVTSYPYLLFIARNGAPTGIQSVIPDVEALIDNVAICTAYDVEISEADCDQLCVFVSINHECAVYNCSCEDECEITIVIQDGETEYDTLETDLSSIELCIPRNESGEYLIILYAQDCNGLLIFDTIEYVIPDCDPIVISTNTTWTTANVPNGGRMSTLTIESDATLTIESDVVVSFCPDGSLVIEPNAELRLHGTLTSACDEPWDGVKVYGDNTENQYYDFGNSQYYHGSLRGFPGSVIENAVTSVELFGPDPEDTGGRISCNGTTFLNHEKGVVFGLYANMVGTIPHQYRGSFSNCIFKVDNNYLHGTPFLAHIDMTGVLGVTIVGSDFINAKTNNSATLVTDFGYGILSKGAGFTVSAISPDYPDECVAPCDRSTFTGLGYGVLVNAAKLRNRAFTVNHSDFSNCYVGIGVDGVSASTMIYNRFYLGEIPDVDVMDGDQIGINLRKGINGVTLEENEFESTDVNTNATMGIVLDNILDYDNIIRRNTFQDLTISIEAFGENGNPTKDAIEGVMFLCNKNSGTDLLDFYIPDEAVSGYPINSINRRQGLSGTDGISFIATGNKFSNSSPEDYRDFANHGGFDIKYWHYTGDADQILNEYIGVSDVFSGDENTCGNNQCLPPCPIVIADEREVYLENVAPYLHAMSVEEWDTAAMYKSYLDQIALRATQFYLSDTVTYNEDSLITWYKRMNTPMGHVLASKLKAAQGNYTTATTLLGVAAGAFDLTAQGDEDLDSIQSIYSILSVRSVENLIAGDFDRLETIALMPGHASAMARGILSQHGYHFEPEYYLPEEEEFFIAPNPGTPVASGPEVYVYPNPFDGQQLFVYVPDLETKQEATLELFDATGKRLLMRSLESKHNRIAFDKSLLEGMVFYRITGISDRTSSGILTIIK